MTSCRLLDISLNINPGLSTMADFWWISIFKMALDDLWSPVWLTKIILYWLRTWGDLWIPYGYSIQDDPWFPFCVWLLVNVYICKLNVHLVKRHKTFRSGLLINNNNIIDSIIKGSDFTSALPTDVSLNVTHGLPTDAKLSKFLSSKMTNPLV